MATSLTHKVVSGNTLSEIAVRYGTTVKKLMELNPDIKDADLIYVGQEIVYSGTGTQKTTNTTYKATITAFGLQSKTDNVLFATWAWDLDNTEKYQIRWKYQTSDGKWFYGSNSSISVDENDEDASKQSTYTIPNNATNVSFSVKPVSKKKSGASGETTYWTANWSTEKRYDVSKNPPGTPSTPSVTIEKYTLTAKLDNLDSVVSKVEFQVVKDDKTVFKSGTATVTTSSVSYSCTVDSGGQYKVRCRAIKSNNAKSEWSNYSSNVSTMPSAPAGFTICRASSETSVYLEWAAVNSATSYDIEYATKKEYFDGSDSTTTTSSIESTHFEKTGLETGTEYFFRLRANNSKGSSAWSKIKSVIIGKKPAAPTTWSSTTTAIVGESLNLYWVHNAEDGSSQTYAELELYIDGVKETHTIKNSTAEDEKDKTSYWAINTSEYTEGVQIQWRVRTAGVTKVYGDWSVQRTVDIYAPPTLELGVLDAAGSTVEILTSFPLYISALAGPNTQAPIGYHVTIISNDTYETVDNIGNDMIVTAGDQIYSKNFDTSDKLLITLSANNINLENNVSYTVRVTVSMNSGLTTESSVDFSVGWEDVMYDPNAEISIDPDIFAAYIRPYCTDMQGTRIEGVTLSVYRREYDGKFIELATGISNAEDTFITDPHPALDYARYRIVAISDSTGAVSYYDLPGIYVGGSAAIIQWNEDWSAFEALDEDPMVQPAWSGSMLKLPYNISVSSNHKSDVQLVEYIGREHPTAYYGTQVGETQSWSTVIDKTDTETLYSLRRLQKWMGNVYAREPSGSGYWANVTVSFNEKFSDLIIPVSISLTRVEGGA